MSGDRIARVDIHVPVKAGTVRVIHAGDVIPEDLLERVTNPNVFVEVESGEDLADKAAEAAAAIKAGQEAEAKAKADADKIAATAAAKAKADADAAAAAGEQGAPAGPDLAHDLATEPEHGTPYLERSHKSLQAAAKARGLKADGKQDVLVARLEADDRERTENE